MGLCQKENNIRRNPWCPNKMESQKKMESKKRIKRIGEIRHSGGEINYLSPLEFKLIWVRGRVKR